VVSRYKVAMNSLMKIRKATAADITDMAALSEEKRELYETFQPIFWRKATHSKEIQIPYLEKLLAKDNHFALVCETNGIVSGFIIGAVTPAPPVYDPGGLACLIDDFCISSEARWDKEGEALLAESCECAKQLGAVQFVIICGHKDERKREMLRKIGLTIASEWYTGPV